MKPKIVQSPEKPIASEIIAASILEIAEGVRKLRSCRLTDSALVLLIQHAAPKTGSKYNKKALSRAEVEAVLEGIDSLEREYLKPKKP